MVRMLLVVLMLAVGVTHAAAVELDVDGNGAVDVASGGTNAMDAANARMNIGAGTLSASGGTVMQYTLPIFNNTSKQTVARYDRTGILKNVASGGTYYVTPAVAGTDYLSPAFIVNDLITDSATKMLSAAQGKVLKDLADTKLDASVLGGKLTYGGGETMYFTGETFVVGSGSITLNDDGSIEAVSLYGDGASLTNVPAASFAVNATACSSGNRGSVRYVAGAPGAADVMEACTKSAADAYAWRAVFTAP